MHYRDRFHHTIFGSIFLLAFFRTIIRHPVKTIFLSVVSIMSLFCSCSQTFWVRCSFCAFFFFRAAIQLFMLHVFYILDFRTQRFKSKEMNTHSFSICKYHRSRFAIQCILNSCNIFHIFRFVRLWQTFMTYLFLTQFIRPGHVTD